MSRLQMAKSKWQMKIIKITNMTITRWLPYVRLLKIGQREYKQKTRKQIVINKSHMVKSKQKKQLKNDKWLIKKCDCLM